MLIIGSDEAGYGTWAGPLIVVAVALPDGWSDPLVTDSKKLSDKMRRAAVQRHGSLAHSIQIVSPEEIDRIGVYPAVIEAHIRAHKAVRERVSHETTRHIVDGLENARRQLNNGWDGPPWLCPESKADGKYKAVGLASCFAKTAQVDAMLELDKQHPRYDFAQSRGYGTPTHQHALKNLGPIEGVHRMSYSPIKRYLAEKEPAGHVWPWEL